jgi:hypothetical protein
MVGTGGAALAGVMLNVFLLCSVALVLTGLLWLLRGPLPTSTSDGATFRTRHLLLATLLFGASAVLISVFLTR